MSGLSLEMEDCPLCEGPLEDYGQIEFCEDCSLVVVTLPAAVAARDPEHMIVDMSLPEIGEELN